jgi:hypothetical protein
MPYKKALRNFALKLSLLMLILNVLCVRSGGESEIFSDGFESGNFSAWTGTNGSPSIVTSPVHHGSYAAQADAQYEYWYKTFNGQNTVYVRFYFRLSARIYFEMFYIYAGSNSIGTLMILSNGNIRYRYKNGASDAYLPSWDGYAANLQTNTWYCIEIKHTISGTNGEIQMWLNGNSIASASGKDTDNYGNINQILMGRYYGSGTCTVTFDCVVVADTYIGPEAAETKFGIALTSEDYYKSSENYGTVIIDGKEYQLPNVAYLSWGTHNVAFTPAEGHRFLRWEGVNINIGDKNAQSTTIIVNGNGSLKAVYVELQATIYRITVNSTQHQKYRLTYPVTYEFAIPSNSSGLSAYKRNGSNREWTKLTEKTSNEVFNGIECVRFDYTEDIAYISVAFPSESDDIYIKITNNAGAIQPIRFLRISKYYDNRRMAVYAIMDDYTGYPEDLPIIDLFQEKNVWITLGIITQNVLNWSTLQNEVNEGFVECASHSRTHPSIPYGDYDSEIGGSKADILNNLTLPEIYDGSVWAWIEPGGESDQTVRQKLYAYDYLIARRTDPADYDYVAWVESEQLFQRVGAFSADKKTAEQLNTVFDSCYQNNGIHGIYFHSTNVYLGELRAHLDHIKNKLDVWYVGFGALYAYRYVATVADIYIVPSSENDAPIISSFEAPNIAYANKYFLLNATINDGDGIVDFINATVEISNDIILKWDNATDIFSIYYDPNSYCILDVSGCLREQLNSTAYRLSWKIKLDWAYPEGYVSIVSTNTKVYDSVGNYDSKSKNNLFYFEDDLIVYSATVDDSRINPSQTITFSGTLYYQGTTTPPEDTSGITAKIELDGILKGSTTTIGTDGTFSIDIQGESNTARFSYVLFASTDENTVQNRSIDVIVDRIIVTEGGVTKETLVLDETTTVWFIAAYEYDGSTFTDANGSLYTNGFQMSWSQKNRRWEYIYEADAIGLVNFAVSGVYDASQGLTVINDAAGTQTITVWSTPFTVISNSTITELIFDSKTKTITFTVTGTDGTMGSTNVTISKELIQEIDGLQIYMDGNPINYIVTPTKHYWSINFIYTHSTHKVLIVLKQNTSLVDIYLTTKIVTLCVAILLLSYIKVRKNAGRNLAKEIWKL